MLPTVMRGLSDAYGSWNTIWRWRRCLRIALPSSLVRSVPSKMTSPEVGLYSCRIARPVVDFPQPDSPTSPSVSPRFTWKETPSTAWTAPTLRWKIMPCVSGKCMTRFRTSSRGAASLADAPPGWIFVCGLAAADMKEVLPDYSLLIWAGDTPRSGASGSASLVASDGCGWPNLAATLSWSSSMLTSLWNQHAEK